MIYLAQSQISCTIAAIRKAPFWRRSLSSSNNKAVRQPHPLGAFGRSVPVCFKLPNNITSLLDGQISLDKEGWNKKPKRRHTFFLFNFFLQLIYETRLVKSFADDHLLYLITRSNLFTRIYIHMNLKNRGSEMYRF